MLLGKMEKKKDSMQCFVFCMSLKANQSLVGSNQADTQFSQSFSLL